MIHRHCIALGGLAFGIVVLEPCWDLSDQPLTYQQFFADVEPQHVVEFGQGVSSAPSALAEMPSFQGAQEWLIEQDGREGVLIQNQEGHLLLALFDVDYRHGWVRMIPPVCENVPLYGLGHRWLSRFAAGALALCQGSFLHALGVSVQGKGLLFVGTSGTGKTTLARLWNQVLDAQILSDDMVIARKVDGHYLLYGTPWVSAYDFANMGGVPLEAICFLHQDPINWLEPKKSPPLEAELRSEPLDAWYSARMRAVATTVLEDLAVAVPSFDFGFRPDTSAVSYVRERLGL